METVRILIFSLYWVFWKQLYTCDDYYEWRIHRSLANFGAIRTIVPGPAVKKGHMVITYPKSGAKLSSEEKDAKHQQIGRKLIRPYKAV